MTSTEFHSWREEVLVAYRRELEQITGTGPRWETYHDVNRRGGHWRLWNSIEALDITLSLIGDLARRARRKRKHELSIRIDQVQECVNLALIQLDPDNWRRHRFMDFSDNTRRLKAALECLEQAFMLFRDCYEQISVDVEALRGRDRSSVLSTLAIYRQLRDAAYGLEKYLACEGSRPPREQDHRAEVGYSFAL